MFICIPIYNKNNIEIDDKEHLFLKVKILVHIFYSIYSPYLMD